MIRDITLGQYYAGESVIHRLTHESKIIGTILFIAELFIVHDFIGFAFCGAALAIIVGVSKVPPALYPAGIETNPFNHHFYFCLNIFMVDGRVIWQWGFLKITVEGLYTAAFMGLRLVLLIIGSSLLTLTTKPISLTDAIERLLRPLNRIGVPTHEIAMMMSIALRFIPTLLGDGQNYESSASQGRRF